MIKLQDFAVECGVTDRQVQRLVKKYESEIGGHFVRRGVNGTWLDDDACKILRSKMKTKEIVISDQNINELQNQIEELRKRIELKDVIIENLQARELQKDNKIAELEQAKLQIEGEKQEELRAAVTKVQEELVKQHGEEIDSLNTIHDAEVLELKRQLDEEKSRSLTWKERIFGKKKTSLS